MTVAWCFGSGDILPLVLSSIPKGNSDKSLVLRRKRRTRRFLAREMTVDAGQCRDTIGEDAPRERGEGDIASHLHFSWLSACIYGRSLPHARLVTRNVWKIAPELRYVRSPTTKLLEYLIARYLISPDASQIPSKAPSRDRNCHRFAVNRPVAHVQTCCERGAASSSRGFALNTRVSIHDSVFFFFLSFFF